MTARLFPSVAIALALTALAPAAAHAQMAVYDAASYAKLIQQAETAAAQLEQLKQQVTQGQRLFDSLNQATNVNAIAAALGAPALRNALPDVNAFSAAARGDLGALGRIGQQAAAIRDSNRLYTPPAGDALGADLDAAGNRAARDLATAQTVGDAGAQRLAGLQALQAAIGTAADARAVLDLQTRLGAESAMTANDQMRLQALAMTEAAEERLARQRAQERAAAASQARMTLYRSSFQ